MSRVTHRYVDGRLVESTATPEAVRVHLEYEEQRLVRVERAVLGELVAVSALQYDERGYLASVTFSAPSGEPPTLVRRARRVFRYDERGRLVAMNDEGMDGTEIAVCTLTYDAEGRLATARLREHGLESTDAPSLSYHYDADGRVSEVRSPYLWFRYTYDRSGWRAGVAVSAPEGDVLETQTLLRDDQGRVSERRSVLPGDESVARIEYQGSFLPGSECGAGPPAPPGIPDVPQLHWLERVL